MPKILGIAAILEMASAMAGAFSVTVLSLFKMNVYYLFSAALVVGLISIAVALLIKDTGVKSPKLFPSLSYKTIFELSIPTIPCGLGSGLVIPLLSLWFKIRYGATAGEVGLVFGAMDFAMLVFMWFTPNLASKIGKLKVVVYGRSASSLALLLMAFSPTFWLAGFNNIKRRVCDGRHARQAILRHAQCRQERAGYGKRLDFFQQEQRVFVWRSPLRVCDALLPCNAPLLRRPHRALRPASLLRYVQGTMELETKANYS